MASPRRDEGRPASRPTATTSATNHLNLRTDLRQAEWNWQRARRRAHREFGYRPAHTRMVELNWIRSYGANPSEVNWHSVGRHIADVDRGRRVSLTEIRNVFACDTCTVQLGAVA